MDGVADHLLRHAAEVGLAEEPVNAELGVQVEDLLGDLRGPADHQGAATGGQGRHGVAVDIEPAAAVGLRGQVAVVVRVEVAKRLLLGLADVEVAGDTDGQLIDGVAGVTPGSPVEVD